MDRAAEAPSQRRCEAALALARVVAGPLFLAGALPLPAHALDAADLLRNGASLQAATQAQRSLQEQRTADPAQRLRADADACAPVKAWVASVPGVAVSRRTEDSLALLDDERFAKSFGKTYDQLTIADLRQLQETQAACQRAGTLTPAEQQLVQQLFNPATQPQYARQLAAARADKTRVAAAPAAEPNAVAVPRSAPAAQPAAEAAVASAARPAPAAARVAPQVEPTASSRVAPPAEPTASSKVATPPSGKPAAATGGTVLTDASELRKYEAGHIVRAVYHADTASLKEDAIFTRKYLIAQAGHLGGNCDTFKASEVRAYENALAREVATSVQRNSGELLRQSLNLYVQAQRNMASIVDAGAAQQRLEDAPEFAVSDIERLARTYGGCDSAVIVRYTRNLRNALERGR